MGKNQSSFDADRAREAGRKSAEARKARQDTPERPEVPSTPVETLRALSLDENVPSYARVNAAKALAALEPPEPEHRWQDSPQVQPGYQTPVWNSTISFALEIGAVSGPELVLLAVENGDVHLCDDCMARVKKEAA